MEHTGFPSDETLAAFLDGNLDPDTRRRVIEHMTSCEECYSVVAGGGAPPPVYQIESVISRPKAGVGLRRSIYVGLTVAAGISGVALLIGPVRDAISPKPVPTPVQVLADAAPTERRIEGRLTGFRYAPRERVSRGEDPS